MKRKVNYNLIYEKLLRMRPEKPVAESLKYKVLARAISTPLNQSG